MKKSELLSKLSILSKGLERNKELPIYEYICFSGEIAYTSNMMFTITMPMSVKNPFGVNGNTFVSLLTASPSEDMTFKVEGTDLIVKVGSSNFELPIKTQDEFIWKDPKVTGIEFNTIIAESVRYLLPTCSENQALEAFARICIKNEKGIIMMYSTDGDALTKFNTGILSSDRINVTLSRKFSQIIAEVLPNGNITINKDWIMISSDEMTIYGQNLGESSLDYENEITNLLSDDGAEMVKIPAGFRESLERAMVVSHHETSPTSILVDEGKMHLITETPFGNVYDTINLEHEEIEIKVNAEMLLKQAEDLDYVKFTPSCVVLKNDKMLKLVATMG